MFTDDDGSLLGAMNWDKFETMIGGLSFLGPESLAAFD
jgi:hypothetical protein